MSELEIDPRILNVSQEQCSWKHCSKRKLVSSSPCPLPLKKKRRKTIRRKCRMLPKSRKCQNSSFLCIINNYLHIFDPRVPVTLILFLLFLNVSFTLWKGIYTQYCQYLIIYFIHHLIYCFVFNNVTDIIFHYYFSLYFFNYLWDQVMFNILPYISESVTYSLIFVGPGFILYMS